MARKVLKQKLQDHDRKLASERKHREAALRQGKEAVRESRAVRFISEQVNEFAKQVMHDAGEQVKRKKVRY